VETLVSIIIGGLITGLVSRYYYHRASRDMVQEAERLRRETKTVRQETEDVRHYINALISYLEAANVITVRRDEHGRPIEVKIIKLEGTISSTGTFGEAEIEVKQPESQPPES
jgi:hypothetical protein